MRLAGRIVRVLGVFEGVGRVVIGFDMYSAAAGAQIVSILTGVSCVSFCN